MEARPTAAPGSSPNEQNHPPDCRNEKGFCLNRRGKPCLRLSSCFTVFASLNSATFMLATSPADSIQVMRSIWVMQRDG